MKKTRQAWIGMGSNQGDRFELLQQAIYLMIDHSIHVQRISTVYETLPVGFESDTTFLNAVAEITFAGSSLELLQLLLELEAQLGRKRTDLNRYESRTIDLDILLVETEVINNARLIVPHPKMHERSFVLLPLNELIPSYIHPILKSSIAQLAQECIEGNSAFIHDKALSINH